MAVIKNIVWTLLLVFLLPVWMVLGLGAVAVVVGRQLYWWARGNTTAASRSAGPATDLSPAVAGVSGR